MICCHKYCKQTNISTLQYRYQSKEIRMDFLTCWLINGPFCVINIWSNAFYVFCMVFPPQGERIKQPLKFLLGSLICCTVIYLMSVIMLFFINDSFNFQLLFNKVSVLSMSTSLYSSVWLNFFYYTQIVPSKRALFIWIKKNIKPFIYCIWLAEKMLILFEFGVSINCIRYNATIIKGTVYFQIPESEFVRNLIDSSSITSCAYFFICLCVMMMASCSTVVYLCKHMCSMVANGQPFSCPKFKSQVRVTITGTLQVVLYMIFAGWIIYNQSPDTLFNPYKYFTAVNIYMVGTSFNLGAGQAVFRQRAEDIWLRAVQLCKSPKVKQSEQGG